MRARVFKDRKVPKHADRLLFFPFCLYFVSLKLSFNMRPNMEVKEYFEGQHIQSNLDGSNTDGSFTMANSNSIPSPYEILPIAQENKYLRKFSYFIVKLYVVCTH